MVLTFSLVCASKKPPPPAEARVNSTTKAAKIEPTIASKAFPPISKINCPASAVFGCPAAIAPLLLRVTLIGVWGVGCRVWGVGSGVWGSGEVGKWGEGRINKNNLLSPVSCLLSPE